VAAKKVETDTRFPVPKKLTSHGPARIIAMSNQKGGVGKTTTAVNVAAALAGYGRKVLVVDLDPQGALTAHFGVDAKPGDIATIYEAMKGQVDAKDVIVATEVKNLDLMPANIDLSAAEIEFVTEVAREHILANVLRKVRDSYDVIIIDCQPSLGILTVNALTAADGVVIPMAADFFALRGVALLLANLVHKVQERLNPVLKLDGIIITMNERTSHSREVLASLYEHFGDKVFKTQVNRTVKFKYATAAQKPITEYEPNSEAAESYRAVARELIARGCSA
jgi:chromosome partitioning protein